MPELTPAEYQRIIAALSEGKARAELEALEFRTRYATAAGELEEFRAGQDAEEADRG